jgi:hypothetical protein
MRRRRYAQMRETDRRALEEIYEAESARLSWIVRAIGEVIFRRRSTACHQAPLDRGHDGVASNAMRTSSSCSQLGTAGVASDAFCDPPIWTSSVQYL